MEKTELAIEVTLRAYMHDGFTPTDLSPGFATLYPPAPQMASIAPPLAASTEFVHAANVAPIGPKRICAG